MFAAALQRKSGEKKKKRRRGACQVNVSRGTLAPLLD
jgi:hypothetical protein